MSMAGRDGQWQGITSELDHPLRKVVRERVEEEVMVSQTTNLAEG